jgi:hypothetical protein
MKRALLRIQVVNARQDLLATVVVDNDSGHTWFRGKAMLVPLVVKMFGGAGRELRICH